MPGRRECHPLRHERMTLCTAETDLDVKQIDARAAASGTSTITVRNLLGWIFCCFPMRNRVQPADEARHCHDQAHPRICRGGSDQRFTIEDSANGTGKLYAYGNTDSPAVKINKFLQALKNGDAADPATQAAQLLEDLRTAENMQAPDIKAQLQTLELGHRSTQRALFGVEDGADDDIGNYLLQQTRPAGIMPGRSSHGGNCLSKTRRTIDAITQIHSETLQKVEHHTLLDVTDQSLITSICDIVADEETLDMVDEALAMALINILWPIGRSFFCNITHLEDVTQGRALSLTGVFIIHQHGLVKSLNLDRERLVNYLLSIEDGYPAENPYHNSVHAADVMQRRYTILMHLPLGTDTGTEADIRMLAALVASMVHDVLHTGLNNNFMVRAGRAVARQFNDQAVLENQSLLAALELLRNDRTNFLKGSKLEGWESSNWRKFKAYLVDMVLATDMGRHFGIVSEFQQQRTLTSLISAVTCEDQAKPAHEDPAAVTALLQMAIKMADIGHCSTRLQQHMYWLKGLEVEFFAQGDKERDKWGSEISPLMDRNRPGPMDPRSQIGFFKVIVLPMQREMADAYPSLKPILDQSLANLAYWQSQAAKKDKYRSFPQDFYKEMMWHGFMENGTICDPVAEGDCPMTEAETCSWKAGGADTTGFKTGTRPPSLDIVRASPSNTDRGLSEEELAQLSKLPPMAKLRSLSLRKASAEQMP